MPQSCPPAAPVTHLPLPVVSQQPPLHASVCPPLMQTLPQVCEVGSQAWLVGQSVEVAQPHLPATQWFDPVHAPQEAAFVPQEPSVVPERHIPLVGSQQPVAHVVESQFS